MNFKVGTLLAVSLLGLTACGGNAKKEITAEEWQAKAAKVTPVEYTKATVKYSGLSEEGEKYSGSADFTWSGEEWVTNEANIPEDVEDLAEMIGANAKEADFEGATEEDLEPYTFYSDLSFTMKMEQSAEQQGISMSMKMEQTMKFDEKDGAVRSLSYSYEYTISGIPDEMAEVYAEYGLVNGTVKSNAKVSISYSK